MNMSEINKVVDLLLAVPTAESDADKLGFILAAKSAIEAEEKAIKGSLVDSHEGSFYKATVSLVETDRIDWKTVAEKLKPSRQLITAHTNHTRYKRVSVKSL